MNELNIRQPNFDDLGLPCFYWIFLREKLIDDIYLSLVRYLFAAGPCVTTHLKVHEPPGLERQSDQFSCVIRGCSSPWLFLLGYEKWVFLCGTGGLLYKMEVECFLCWNDMIYLV